MLLAKHGSVLFVAGVLLLFAVSWADEPSPSKEPAPALPVTQEFFETEVWAKVGALECLKCHKLGGDAEDTRFVLVDPKRVAGAEQAQALRQNRE